MSIFETERCLGCFEDFGASCVQHPASNVTSEVPGLRKKSVYIAAEALTHQVGHFGGKNNAKTFFGDRPAHHVFGFWDRTQTV